jgi:prepilin-type N-terminal cleavage/methylation domain-containing protein
MEATIYPVSRRRHDGFSLVETVIVLAILAAVIALAVPNFLNAQRLMRSAAVSREVATQLKLARQESLSQLRAMTVQYNDTTKQLVVIRHATYCLRSGPWPCPILADPNYPNNGVIIRTVPLTGSGLAVSELTYGRPSGVPTAALGDSTNMTALGAGNTINITFQPDGSVIDANGNPANFALFQYNNKVATNTATAVSVLGAGGRVKIWRYSSSANKYME